MKAVACAALCLVAGLLWSAPARPAAKKPTSPRSASAAKKGGAKKGTRRAARGPARQQQPAPERYREIQQALIDRGLMAGTPTGEWGAESIAAMKRFQEQQSLRADGKLSAMSVIALGLGPKRPRAAEVVVGPNTNLAVLGENEANQR
ncbi:MAG: peptidoglycan-binding protein [Acidobacteria bacterium]|nr:peptidoglycan-binding protein [Acidobacteriota bacterium]